MKIRKNKKKTDDLACRTINVYPEDELVKAMRRKLDSEEGKRIYGQRGKTIELVHGDMQKNRRFLQFALRGLKKVNIEYFLLGIAHNIRKIILHRADEFREMCRYNVNMV